MQGGFDESKYAGSEADCARRRGDCDHRGGCLAVRAKTQEYDHSPAEKIWARVRAGGASAWGRTKSGSEVRGSREAGGKTHHSRSCSDGTVTLFEAEGVRTVAFCRLSEGGSRRSR